ncbi:DNA-binding transcriptional MerR regulator [Kribbella sp. VKM Ac-2568]|nr:DNA-binding transcriptional MerR regulator [Kribbella sp. VKM Ac-2568]
MVVNDDELYSIGELARRTGVSVKTIRFYSDRGLVPPTDRSPAGYRRYDLAAVARLDLIRTLRELGLDLTTVRRVLDHEIALSEVAAAHAAALTVQIRTLRLRRAILTAVSERGSTPEELNLMHRLARLSEAERDRLIGDFLDTVFGDDPDFAAIRRTLTAELPDHPTTAQLEAWVELAELSQDPGFRSAVRQMAEDYKAARGPGRVPLRPGLVARIREQVDPAVRAGIDPHSPEADAVLRSLTADYAAAVGAADDDHLRARLAELLQTANDPRWAQYLTLLATINGWAAPEPLAPIYDWTIEALLRAG